MKFAVRSIAALITIGCLVEPSQALRRRRRLHQTIENKAAVNELVQKGILKSEIEYSRQLVGEVSSAVANALPVQTFYVPLPEILMFTQIFYQINHQTARPPVESMVSMAISTDQTIIWYDHWEDGYDANVVTGTAATTEIWGDGNASNGCPPDISPCTNSNDRLMAGDTIVIQNTVSLPRDASHIRYDGSDRIQSSFPIAVTRGAYPANPGSLMAGAVEVLDKDTWGLTFEAPIGADVGRSYRAFSLSLFFFMAAEDRTRVTLPNGYVVTLNQGQGAAISVDIGQQIRSNKPIQVDLITGEINSQFELRWYSMLPLEHYGTQYYSPVGDTYGKTKNLIYNPGPQTAQIAIHYREEVTNQTRYIGGYLGANQATFSPVNPTGSGMAITASSPIIALSLTDTENTVSNGDATGGQFFDWGFPVVPIADLTSQVLIGWGYGCTNNNCYGQKDRSVVWVSPIRNADVYVDYNNQGANYEKHSVKQLQSMKFTDNGDHDMSGAVIFATEPESGPNGNTVPIAAAWGQDPSVSKQYQSISLDLGTTVPPMQEIAACKLVDQTSAYPGDVLTYTIRAMNLGQRILQPNLATIKDELGDYIEYVEGSTFYSSYTEGLGLTQVNDDVSGTKFPLDGNGFVIPVSLSRRGGVFDISFKVKVASIDHIKKVPIVNSGTLASPMITKDRAFSAWTQVLFDPAVKIENTVYVGADSGASCETKGVELAQGVHGSSVAYCFKITNTGESYLKDIYLTNEDLSYESSVSNFMAPGESVTVVTGGSILSDLQNTATVTAVPVLKDGTILDDYDLVEDSDASEVGKIVYIGALSVENTVHFGHDSGAKCSTDETFEKVEGIMDSPVTYCFTIKNIGDSYLNGLVLSNPALQYSKSLPDLLAPDGSTTVVLERDLTGNLKNVASVTATPVLGDGSSVGLSPITVTDPSEVEKLVLHASLAIKNSVYAGHDSGAKCGSANAGEFVGDFAGTDVTYCIEIANTGQTYLDGLKVDNADISYHEHSSIPNLAPNEKHILFVEREITKSLVNSASVVGNPVFGDGRDLVDLDDVTDSDTSEVSLLAHEPNLSAIATVYAGSDNGSSCGTSRAKKSAEDFIGTAVVYCFTFHNTGNTHLTDIQFVNDELSFDQAVSGHFAPGASQTVSFSTTMPPAMSSTVEVSAHPVNDDGEAITGSTDVNASDDVHVTGVEYLPSVSVENTVYFGEESVGNCESRGEEFAEAEIGSTAVYCWKITNTGNTHLKSLTLRNDVLGIEQKDVLASVLSPGASFTYTATQIVTRREQNIVNVIAEPSTAAGTDLPHQDVSDSDPSEVSPTAMNPSLMIKNTVYSGTDSGALCGSGADIDKLADIFKTDIQYCFVLKNDGDTFLSNIKIVNDDLAYVNEAISSEPLAPGDSISVSVPSKLLQSSVNVAIASGTPCWMSGIDECSVIPDHESVTHSDSSEIEKLQFDVGVSIENTVLLGSHTGILGREKCPGEEYVEDYPESDISYCLSVTNTGTSYLGEITLASKKIMYFKTLTELLAPGSSTTIAVPTEITGSMEAIANVTATPYTADERKILDHAIVSAYDAASVGMLDLSPSVTISNKVYLGDDDGASCGTSIAVDKVEESFGEAVTYCFIVTNDGDAHLATIIIEDDILSFHNTSIEKLAPGESATVSLPATIAATTTNTAVVTAKPVLESGKDIGMDTVTSSDTSEVKEIAFQPSIHVDTKVYVGDEGVQKCGDAEEHVEGIAGTVITYCMTLTNTGDSHLSGTQLSIASLDYSIAVDGTLAPGESKSIVYKLPIEDTTEAVAAVTSNPTLEDGTDIPSAEIVTSSDPANHELIPFSPSVHIDNLIYIGDEGVTKCSSARDYVEGPYGESITYCFTITNTGNTPLGNPMTVTDDVLGISQSVDGFLAPGATTTITVPGRIEGATRTIATVIANPLHLDGSDISVISDVESSDSSTSNLFDYVGNVKIENKVYLGDDGGAKCGTDEPVEVVQGIHGSQATYCFVVTNTGDTYLADISVIDDELSFSADDFDLLAPGTSATRFLVKAITGDLLNSARVYATPTNAKGEVIPNLEKVTHEDPSEVEKKKHTPKIMIKNTVYLGNDNGAKCGTPEAAEYVADKYGKDATYCFVVSNTGDTTLDNILIENSALGFSYSDVPPLTPNSTATIAYTSPIRGPLTNDVSVSANPVLPDLEDIPDLDDVTATDPSEVGITIHNPNIRVENTVYIGTAEDDLCGSDSAKEYVEGAIGEYVTYCFEIENNGDSILSNIVLTNSDLNFSNDSIGQLSPGSVATVALTTSINGYLKNTVSATGVPSLSDGSQIPGTSIVEDSNPSAVGQLLGLINPGNEVGSNSTGSGGDLDLGQLGGGLPDTGSLNGGNLNDIPTLGGDGLPDLGGGSPTGGESLDDIPSLGGEGTTNNVPDDFPDMGLGNSDVGTTPAISIENTVYAGDDLGLACPGGELVEEAIGAPVVYCFLVKNTGDTFLYSIELTDEALDNYEDNSISSLAPGESEYITIQSSVTNNLVNTASVNAAPGLAGGIIFTNVPGVTASDSSEVRKLVDSNVRFTDKSPYTPPSSAIDECIQDKFDGVDQLICATRTVFLKSVIADNAASCTSDGSATITISVEGAITMTQNVNDLGWYIATDGGDAMTGSCVLNGLQEGNTYDVESESNVVAGSVVWNTNGGDGDACGDVIIDAPGGGSITTPIAVELSVPCKDSNEDGTLDFALCFSWSNDNSNGCSISANAPAAATGECYCARYEVPNVSVTTPDDEPLTTC